MALSEKAQKQIWSALTLGLVAIFSLLYILFKERFAKIYLEFSFFHAPVFVGEILLFFCLLSLVAYCVRWPSLSKAGHVLIVAYLLWLAFKISVGFHHWGFLAFRHAALFYYPLFFMIGFVFFDRDLFAKNTILFLFVIIEAIFSLGHYDPFWVLTLACLGIILVLGVKERKWALFMAVVMAIVIPYLFLFRTARMMFVANIISLTLIMAAGFYLWRTKLYIKLLILAFVLIVAALGFYKCFILGESGRLFSSPRQIADNFRKFDNDVQIKEKSFKMESRPAGLYHQQGNIRKVNVVKGISLNYDSFFVGQTSPGKSNPAPAPEEVVSMDNIIFRLFIWRDMFEDWKVHKPLMGVDFGRPLRSPSLEVLHWAQPEWSRDGWIEPHNSYFNILYRAGIMGIIFVVLIWAGIISLITVAFRRESWILILLAAILLNWLIAANFSLILELPYTAIPFWALAGMAWGYAYKKRV